MGLAFDKDWWFSPIRLESDKSIAWTEKDTSDGSTTSLTATISAGLYWGVWSVSAPSTPKSQSGLLKTIADAMGAASADTSYEYDATETEDSTGTDTSRRKTGLALDPTASGFEVRWDFESQSGSWTLPPELVGYDRGIVGTAGGDTDFGDPLVSPKSQFGRWTPLMRQEVGAAVEKPRDTMRSREYSDDDHDRGYEARRDRTIQTRQVVYEKVTALSVIRGRADLDGYPDYAQAADGDDNASLTEHIERAAEGSWLVVHDENDSSDIIGRATLPGTWERAHIEGPEGNLSTDEMTSITKRSPEVYTVTLDMQIAEGAYRQ